MTEVPNVVRELWGLTEPGRRGPKPATSLRTIAAEALTVADEDGLAAVSMSGIAKRLGFTTMALYRYVSSRQDLEVAMVDVALGDPPAAGSGAWRQEVEAWARAELAVLLQHPWVIEVRPGTPPLGPATLGWMDAGLRAVGRAPLEPSQVASSLLMVDGYVRNQVLLRLQFGEGASQWGTQLATVIDRDRMPALGAALDAGAFEEEPGRGAFPEDEFEFGLTLLLDGIERLASD